MNKHHLALLALLALAACNNNNQENNESDHQPEEIELKNDLVGEVMAIHDSIMPSMDRIMKLKSILSANIKELDSLLAKDTKKEFTQKKATEAALLDKLDQADKQMMAWMHQYNGDTLKKIDEQAAKAYLQSQKEKIEHVRDLMQTSIAETETFIGKK
jgi:succinate dehydrogenase flavin-adding protein (antitoxin of CptAB toxin-antitoxin module)